MSPVPPAPARVAILHLVWAPLGAGPLADFIAAYTRHQSGREHQLVVLCNGFSGPGDPRLSEVERALEPVAHERVLLSHPVQDIEAYRGAALELDARWLCVVNSYSQPLAEHWLEKLATPLEDPAVGLTGTCGSYESAYTAAPRWLRPVRRRRFAPFPNPHLRTNGFMIERRLLLELRWPRIGSKVSAWAFESGRDSLARQVWDRGLEVVVVGADGIGYPQEHWRDSATFRSAGQRNLLIADNRTRQYQDADPALQRRLEVMAWGPRVNAERV